MAQPYGGGASTMIPYFNAHQYGRMRIKDITGYCFIFGKALDRVFGQQAENILRLKEIYLSSPPPFEKATLDAGYRPNGVVKINNIPFTVTMQEVKHFISRITPNATVEPHINGFPIHIVMEKPTGKTMDCFVEFPTIAVASDCVRRFDNVVHTSKAKLGTRIVTLDMSNQAELREAIFPRARLIDWDYKTGQPRLLSHELDPSWTEGFRGYFTVEEMFGLTRFAENPARSPFALKCQQRVYESMISTLYKFPWAATETYTIGARDTLFNAVIQQIQTLVRKVGQPSGNKELTAGNTSYVGDSHDKLDREVGLSQKLIMDLLFAALNAHGFSQLQKYAIKEAANLYGLGISLSTFACHWPFQTLHPIPHLENHITKFYLELFDSGYDDVATLGGTQFTTFEKYCEISRNNIGFPVVEWTSAGIELSFEDAMKIESALVVNYVERGRALWSRERGVKSWPLRVQSLNDVLRNAVPIEHESNMTIPQFPSPSPMATSSMEDDTSPQNIAGTTEAFQQLLLNDVAASSAHLPGSKQQINTATNTSLDPTSSSFRPTIPYRPLIVSPSDVSLAGSSNHKPFSVPKHKTHNIDITSNSPDLDIDGEMDTTVPGTVPFRRKDKQPRVFNNLGYADSSFMTDPFIDHGNSAKYMASSQHITGAHHRSKSTLSTHSSPVRYNSMGEGEHDSENFQYYDRKSKSKLPSPSVHLHSRSLSASVHSSPSKDKSVHKEKGKLVDVAGEAYYGMDTERRFNNPLNLVSQTQVSPFGAIGTKTTSSAGSTSRSGSRQHSLTKPSNVIHISDTIEEEQDKDIHMSYEATIAEAITRNRRVHDRRFSSGNGQPGPALMDGEIPTGSAALRGVQQYKSSDLASHPVPAATTTRLSAQYLWNQVNQSASCFNNNDNSYGGTAGNLSAGAAHQIRKRTSAIPIRRPPPTDEDEI